jgi:hypothetical protein
MHTTADSMSHKITLFSVKIIEKQQLQLLSRKPTLWAACPLETDYCWKSFKEAFGTNSTNTPMSIWLHDHQCHQISYPYYYSHCQAPLLSTESPKNLTPMTAWPKQRNHCLTC